MVARHASRPDRLCAWGITAFLLWTALCGALLVAPAQAHPFGPPQQAAVDLAPGSESTVRVRWRVGGTDDLTLLGISLGLLPESRRMMDGAVFYQDADAAALASSPVFADYLLRHVTVRSAGASCAGTVDDVSGLATSGVTLLFACTSRPERPEVAISLLTDLHPEYRTLATGPQGQRAVYAGGTAAHAWRLEPGAEAAIGAGEAGAAGRSAAVQLGAVLGTGALLATGVVLGRRRWLRVRR